MPLAILFHFLCTQ